MSINKIVISVVTLVALVGQTLAVYKFGRCPDVQLQQDFTLENYVGLWYEYARLENQFQSGECTQARYTLRDDGMITVFNSEYNKKGIKTGEAVGKCE